MEDRSAPWVETRPYRQETPKFFTHARDPRIGSHSYGACSLEHRSFFAILVVVCVVTPILYSVAILPASPSGVPDMLVSG